jgi:hypothetical protein
LVQGDELAQGEELAQGAELVLGEELAQGDELVQYEEFIQGDNKVQENEITTPPSRARRGRKKSFKSEHFSIETVAEGATRACCKQTVAYSSGSKIGGTSHLKRHITLGSCPKTKNQEQRVIPPSTGGTDNDGEGTVERSSKRHYRYTGYANATFDEAHSCSYLAKMIIQHDYPLHIVQQPGFTTFIESLQHRFKDKDVDMMEGEVYAIYQKEKENLMQAFSTMPGRISFTVGLWRTSQTLGCVSVAGQFIDCEWKVHRRMLNFMMVPSLHSENALSEAISMSLSDWNLKDKLFTITLANECCSHDNYDANMRDHLLIKSNLMLKEQLFVVRCYAHILNAIVLDVIASIHGVIYNICESIKFIKSTPAHEEKFVEIALQLEVPSTKTLCLDVTTQWNTTYLMLLSALDYKDAFTTLETCDDNYDEAPSAKDWKKVEAACSYLKLLYDSALDITTVANPTSNLFYHEAWKVQLELANGT